MNCHGQVIASAHFICPRSICPRSQVMWPSCGSDPRSRGSRCRLREPWQTERVAAKKISPITKPPAGEPANRSIAAWASTMSASAPRASRASPIRTTNADQGFRVFSTNRLSAAPRFLTSKPGSARSNGRSYRVTAGHPTHVRRAGDPRCLRQLLDHAGPGQALERQSLKTR